MTSQTTDKIVKSSTCYQCCGLVSCIQGSFLYPSNQCPPSHPETRTDSVSANWRTCQTPLTQVPVTWYRWLGVWLAQDSAVKMLLKWKKSWQQCHKERGFTLQLILNHPHCFPRKAVSLMPKVCDAKLTELSPTLLRLGLVVISVLNQEQSSEDVSPGLTAGRSLLFRRPRKTSLDSPLLPKEEFLNTSPQD